MQARDAIPEQPVPVRVPLPRHHLAERPPADELALALQFARAEKSPASRRAYRSDFTLFAQWCEPRGLSPLPASTASIAAFIAWEANRGSKASTIARRLAGIRHAHCLAGYESPTHAEMVRATLRGIRRTLGTRPIRKDPLSAENICAMVELAPTNLAGRRDRALLLLGFSAALRRSELVALDVEDMIPTPAGLRLRIRSSKTDQEQQGTVVAVARGEKVCPVAALEQWLSAAGISSGPVFRSVKKGGHVSKVRLSDCSVANIIKHYAAQAGLDPACVSGHSLRSGFLTSAANRGASIFKMMEVSRHRSVDTLTGYVRDADFFRDHAGHGLL